MRQRDVRHQGFNRERGFSLLEVLIAMAVSTIVMFAIYTTFASGAGTYAKGDVKADIHQNTRASMEFMVHEIRLAGYFPENLRFIIPGPPGLGGCGPPGPGLVGISNAQPTTITICGDIDGDDESELVTYTWFGDTDGDNIVDLGENEIRRQITEEDGTVILEVIAFNISPNQPPLPPLRLFSYIDRANNLMVPDPGACADNNPPCDIGRVIITMTGSEPVSQSAPIGGRSPSPFATRVRNYQLVTDVRPRNLDL